MAHDASTRLGFKAGSGGKKGSPKAALPRSRKRRGAII
jgi:hypothetical protein